MDTLHHTGTTHSTEDSAGTPAALNTTLLDPTRLKEVDPTTGPELTPTYLDALETLLTLLDPEKSEAIPMLQ